MKLLRAYPKTALLIAGSVALYTACGLLFAHAEHIPAWHGLYCATANAMTEGDCDVQPTTALAYIVNTVEHLALVAIGAAALGVFTSRVSSALIKAHVEDAAEVIKQHTEQRLRHHLGKAPEPEERTDGQPQ